jgi:hypothetical protein
MSDPLQDAVDAPVMEFCELTSFLHFWLTFKPLRPPLDNALDFSGSLSGLVLYRSGQYQVQLFLLRENCIIKPHCHPNCDSYELAVSGKVAFEVNGFRHEDRALWDAIRVLPADQHTAYVGAGGGAFISIQHWLNNTQPTSVGWDWSDEMKRQKGSADPTSPETYFKDTGAVKVASDYYLPQGMVQGF